MCLNSDSKKAVQHLRRCAARCLGQRLHQSGIANAQLRPVMRWCYLPNKSSCSTQHMH